MLPLRVKYNDLTIWEGIDENFRKKLDTLKRQYISKNGGRGEGEERQSLMKYSLKPSYLLLIESHFVSWKKCKFEKGKMFVGGEEVGSP